MRGFSIMKKFLIGIILFSGIGFSVSANEHYKASTYNSDMKKNMQIFKQMYEIHQKMQLNLMAIDIQDLVMF